MKKILTLIVAAGIMVAINPLHAQTLKEKLKAKLDAADKKIKAKGNAGSYQPNFNLDAPQDESAKSWTEDSYPYFQKKDSKWVETNKTNVKLLKDANGIIQSVKLGGGEYKLKGQDAGFGKYYFYDSYKLGLILDSSIMVVFKTLDYSIVATVNKRLSNSDESTQGKIEAYVVNAEEILTQKFSADADKRMEERIAKFGLKGKDVASIKIENLVVGKNGKIGCYSNVSYDIVATLKNGTKISTADGGFKSDYEISMNDAQLEGGKLKATINKKDVFSIDVKVKSDPSKTTREEIVIPYNQAISFNWSGTGWSRSRGESARNIIIELKQTKHTETGADLLLVRIKGTDGSVLSQFKIAPDMNIIVKLKGGYGGNDGATVFAGGNGGNIKVVKDPNVKSYSLDAQLEGGSGGTNQAGRSAASGSNGSIKEEIRPLTF